MPIPKKKQIAAMTPEELRKSVALIDGWDLNANSGLSNWKENHGFYSKATNPMFGVPDYVGDRDEIIAAVLRLTPKQRDWVNTCLYSFAQAPVWLASAEDMCRAFVQGVPIAIHYDYEVSPEAPSVPALVNEKEGDE